MANFVLFSFLFFSQNLGEADSIGLDLRVSDIQAQEKFMGCVWSPSECRWSCAGYDYFRYEYRPDLCELYDNSPWACYCEDEF